MKPIIAIILILTFAIAPLAFASSAAERKAQLTAQIKALQAEKKAITKDARIEKAKERLAKAQEALNKAKAAQ